MCQLGKTRQADGSSRLTDRQARSKRPYRLRTPMTAAASRAYRAIQDALQDAAGGESGSGRQCNLSAKATGLTARG
jgi:hypothetical protein